MMYSDGDLVVYNNTGVCRVSGTTTLDGVSGIDGDARYYVLDPVFEDGTIYAPVNSKKVFMRPVISKKEATDLIDSIPTLTAEAYHNSSVQQLSEHYQDVLSSHNCGDLIELIMGIYSKKQYVEQHKRKFGLTDSKYMKKAEQLLYGEFAVALDIPLDSVKDYIAQRVEKVAQ